MLETKAGMYIGIALKNCYSFEIEDEINTSQRVYVTMLTNLPCCIRISMSPQNLAQKGQEEIPLKTALRYKLHTIKFTYYKCTTWCFLINL